MNLTNRQFQLLREDSPEGRAFRAGALCEAEVRNAATLLHRELLEYVRALAEVHPDWPSSRIAASTTRVFADDHICGIPTIHFLPPTGGVKCHSAYHVEVTSDLITDVTCQACLAWCGCPHDYHSGPMPGTCKWCGHIVAP